MVVKLPSWAYCIFARSKLLTKWMPYLKNLASPTPQGGLYPRDLALWRLRWSPKLILWWQLISVHLLSVVVHCILYIECLALMTTLNNGIKRLQIFECSNLGNCPFFLINLWIFNYAETILRATQPTTPCKSWLVTPWCTYSCRLSWSRELFSCRCSQERFLEFLKAWPWWCSLPLPALRRAISYRKWSDGPLSSLFGLISWSSSKLRCTFEIQVASVHMNELKGHAFFISSGG